jgi:hypothetical protein
MNPSTTERTCTNCAHYVFPEAGELPHCVNLIPIEDGDVLRCYEHHQTPGEDAADIAAHAAIRKAKGLAQ